MHDLGRDDRSDRTHTVEFVGGQIGERRELGEGRNGRGPPTPGAGSKCCTGRRMGGWWSMSRTGAAGREKPNTCTLVQATPEDFVPNGRFYDLGVECGLDQSRPLNLDEALTTE